MEPVFVAMMVVFAFAVYLIGPTLIELVRNATEQWIDIIRGRK